MKSSATEKESVRKTTLLDCRFGIGSTPPRSCKQSFYLPQREENLEREREVVSMIVFTDGKVRGENQLGRVVSIRTLVHGA